MKTIVESINKVKSPKLTKQLLLRSASKKDSGDDGLKAKQTKERKKRMDHVVSTKLSECKLIVIFFKRCQMCTHNIMCTHIIIIYFPDVMCIRLIFSSTFKVRYDHMNNSIFIIQIT